MYLKINFTYFAFTISQSKCNDFDNCIKDTSMHIKYMYCMNNSEVKVNK